MSFSSSSSPRKRRATTTFSRRKGGSSNNNNNGESRLYYAVRPAVSAASLLLSPPGGCLKEPVIFFGQDDLYFFLEFVKQQQQQQRMRTPLPLSSILEFQPFDNLAQALEYIHHDPHLGMTAPNKRQRRQQQSSTSPRHLNVAGQYPPLAAPTPYYQEIDDFMTRLAPPATTPYGNDPRTDDHDDEESESDNDSDDDENLPLNENYKCPPKAQATWTRTWEEKFELLKQYKEEYGHCNVPTTKSAVPEKYHKLVYWIMSQRSCLAMDLPNDKYKRHAVHLQTPEQKRRLLDLGVTIQSRENAAKAAAMVRHAFRWNEKFQLLQEFKQEFGHCHVPSDRGNKALPKKYAPLYCWCSKQRRKLGLGKLPKEEGKPPSLPMNLSDEEVQKLVDIGLIERDADNPGKFKTPPSLLPSAKEQHWPQLKRKVRADYQRLMEEFEEQFVVLQEFKKEFGHCDVPTGSTTSPHLPEKYWKLAKWVTNLRCKLNREQTGKIKVSTVTPGQKQRLTALGFRLVQGRCGPKVNRIRPSLGVRQQQFNANFEEKIKQLKAFHEEHGHLKPPGESNLYSWLLKQRHNYDAMMERLHGEQNDDDDDDDDDVKKKNDASTDPGFFQMKHAEALRGVGVALTTTRETLQEYVTFVQVNKRFPQHKGGKKDNDKKQTNITASDKSSQDESRLCAEAIKWRSRRTRGESGGDKPLPQYVVDTLDQIQFDWGKKFQTHPTDRRTWDQWVDLLKTYKKEHGHCNVPPRHPELGAFVRQQRIQYRIMLESRNKTRAGKKKKKTTLTPERFQRLARLGFTFVWDGRRGVKRSVHKRQSDLSDRASNPDERRKWTPMSRGWYQEWDTPQQRQRGRNLKPTTTRQAATIPAKLAGEGTLVI